jgi:positive regulator of sigma E activity
MFNEEPLRFYGTWCPRKQTVFCQNREGCGDCCIKDQVEIAAGVNTRHRISSEEEQALKGPGVIVELKVKKSGVRSPLRIF